MQHGIHFISGLPRSGSTLLAALLRQNPRFHSGMTSPVGSLYLALLGEMTARKKLVIHASGRVGGKIRYGKMLVQEGGEMVGDIAALHEGPNALVKT